MENFLYYLIEVNPSKLVVLGIDESNFFERVCSFDPLFGRKKSLSPPSGRWSQPGYPINFDQIEPIIAWRAAHISPESIQNDQVGDFWPLRVQKGKKGRFLVNYYAGIRIQRRRIYMKTWNSFMTEKYWWEGSDVELSMKNIIYMRFYEPEYLV